jgi:hypothetical protein
MIEKYYASHIKTSLDAAAIKHPQEEACEEIRGREAA